MKKYIYKCLILVAGLFVFNSCLDDHVTDFGKGPIVTQFPKASLSQNFLQDGSGATEEYIIPIQYFGAKNEPLDRAVEVTIAVSSDSEAAEGEEFEIPNKTVTIPAGKNAADLVVIINNDNLDPADPKDMVLEIVSSTETVSSNNNIVAVTLQAICPSDLAGKYVFANGTGVEVTVTETGTGTYEVSGDNAFVGGGYPFNFSDLCGELTVTGGYLPDNFGIPVSGYGTVDPETGDITIYYTAEDYFDNRPMIMIKQ